MAAEMVTEQPGRFDGHLVEIVLTGERLPAGMTAAAATRDGAEQLEEGGGRWRRLDLAGPVAVFPTVPLATVGVDGRLDDHLAAVSFHLDPRVTQWCQRDRRHRQGGVVTVEQVPAAATGDGGDRLGVDAGVLGQIPQRVLGLGLVGVDVEDQQTAAGDTSDVAGVAA